MLGTEGEDAGGARSPKVKWRRFILDGSFFALSGSHEIFLHVFQGVALLLHFTLSREDLWRVRRPPGDHQESGQMIVTRLR